MIEAIVIVLAILVVVGLIAAGRSVRVVQQFEQGIVFRFGRIQSPPRGAGLTMIRPVGDRMAGLPAWPPAAVASGRPRRSRPLERCCGSTISHAPIPVAGPQARHN